MTPPARSGTGGGPAGAPDGRSFTPPVFPYRRPAALDAPGPERVAVAIVGGGPAGLAAALEFSRLGVATVLLDEGDTVSTGSRWICWSKRTLEVLDRSGAAGRMVEKGVLWRRGLVFRGARPLYEFDLLPEDGHKMPAFVNLQQYYGEAWMVERLGEFGLAELRWRNRAAGVSFPAGGGALLEVETPDGPYRLHAGYVIAADGARSALRRAMGLDFQGRAFEERFLIADVRVEAGFPAERRFWFDPEFHPGRSALMHRQPDDIVRIDLQLGPGADPEEERRPERVIPRIRAAVGPDVAFEVEWVSVYSFSCRRMARFRHGPVFFAGDAAHVVSPFGARGGNGGIQDIDNLVWKTVAVMEGRAPDRLLDSYDAERVPAADENIRAAARSTDFMTPKTRAGAEFRDAALSLAETEPFARAFVNSGRLSTPRSYRDSPLNAPDDPAFRGEGPAPGAPPADAPLALDGAPCWLLDRLGGGFALLRFAAAGARAEAEAGEAALRAALAARAPGAKVVTVALAPSGGGGLGLVDVSGRAARRWAAGDGTAYLLRPDGHVAARWQRGPAAAEVSAALARCLGEPGGAA